MHPTNEAPGGGASVSTRVMEIVVAVAFIAVGLVVVHDSVRIGFRWSEDGPQAGYFPFWVGVFMIAASIATLVHAIRSPTARTTVFVTTQSLRPVLRMLLPTAAFVLGVYFLGLYTSAALYLGAFMRVGGGFRWRTVAPMALGVPVFLFLLFERWFLIPLPKGPLEALLGY
ncbi:MAG: tripartite tricarboxylate transporter TctB family protein [Ectothiorhodospiraceae bacterium]|nr:tripartite tricarboxylate transporter TctB family protein [Ectothiorhodospiraceae bacterium]